MLTDEEMNDLNVIIARWHGKTTALTIYMLWRVLYYPKWTIIYVASKWLWEKQLWKIRRELELNEKIIEIFWNIVPKNSDDIKDKSLRKWRQKEMEFLNWCTIETLTKGQPIRWQRPKEIIMDDPQENADVKNPERTKEFVTWVFTSLYNTLLPWGRLCALGTIVWNNCLVKHLRDDKKWQTVEYEACDENLENILWPDMWDKQSLIQRRDWKVVTNTVTGQVYRQLWIWKANFNQEFRNIPLNIDDRVIQEHWIRYYSKKTWYEAIIMAVDPATTTKEASDFTWISVVWVNEGKKYVIYNKGVKLPPRKLEEFIIALNKKFEPNLIIKEDNIEVKLTDDLKAKGLPIIWVKAHKDKRTRLLGVAWMIEVWDVYFAQHGQETVIEQLTNFPDVAHDDEMDALVYALMWTEERIEQGWEEWDIIII